MSYNIPYKIPDFRSIYTNKLLIKSVDRLASSSNSSNFVVKLPKAIKGKWIVSCVTIPNSIYTFDASNNKLYFYWDSAARTATITPGVYTSSTIAAELQTQMQTVDAGFTVTRSSATKKLTFTHSTDNFYFNWSTSSGDSPEVMLGFTKATNTANGTSVTAPNVMNLARVLSINVEIREASTRIMTSDVNDDARFSIYIPNTASAGDFFTADYRQHSDMDIIKFDNPTKMLNIKMFDSEGNDVNLNGVDWEMYLTQMVEV